MHWYAVGAILSPMGSTSHSHTTHNPHEFGGQMPVVEPVLQTTDRPKRIFVFEEHHILYDGKSIRVIFHLIIDVVVVNCRPSFAPWLRHHKCASTLHGATLLRRPRCQKLLSSSRKALSQTL